MQPKTQKVVSLAIGANGHALLVMMIAVESEPGALPLGTAFNRSRRLHYRSHAGTVFQDKVSYRHLRWTFNGLNVS